MSGDNLAYQNQDDDVREELIGGEIVAMSPNQGFNHSRVAGQIYTIFNQYLKGHKCIAIQDGLDLYLGERDRFIPDMMVVCDPDKIKDTGVYGPPDLVVEVFSPSTAKRDRTVKLQAYQKYGVREYWIVIPNTRSIEQYLLKDGVFTLHGIYTDFNSKKTPEGKYTSQVSLKCSLYNDLEINLEDIFDRLLPVAKK